jgi:hypothetical protein
MRRICQGLKRRRGWGEDIPQGGGDVFSEIWDQGEDDPWGERWVGRGGLMRGCGPERRHTLERRCVPWDGGGDRVEENTFPG